MKFGSNLRYYRRALGLTQKELGDRIGVTSQAVNKWENGSRLPRMNDVLRICEVLGCTPDDLIKDESETLSAKEASLVSMFRQVPYDVQEIVLTILKSRIEEK